MKFRILLQIAILSDIHGNLEALSTALIDIEQRSINRIVCLGDIVGYGADPGECLNLVISRTQFVIMGNHEEGIINPQGRIFFSTLAAKAIEWTDRQLSPEHKAFLHTLPLKMSFDNLLFVHSTPKSPEEWNYIFNGLDARLYSRYFPERVCFIGHSHIPAVYSMKPEVKEYDGQGRYIINVGSIGQPRDGDSRLSYGLLDTVAGTYENIRLEYDVESAARKIIDNGLPLRLAERLFHGI